MMKKMMMAAVAALMLQGCGMTNPGVNGGSQMGGTTTNNSGSSIGSNALGGLLDLVVGSVKLSQADIIGTWSYVEPACAFTSENLLAKAGGSVAAKTVNEKLLPVYKSLHISRGNTQLTFNENGQFTGKIGGFPMSGTYTFDATNGLVKMKSLTTFTAHLTRSTHGMNFTFESKKILTLLQTVSALSGNTSLSTIGDISKQFSGVRLGFAMKK
ncbi:MAG: DUF4923 family protein [Bacteroidales bacterium]|nr:DUF4923 family protein [Bacteroidales bacterium]MDY4142832.1 DUF4923 family protein [Sodaliphilus sp.]